MALPRVRINFGRGVSVFTKTAIMHGIDMLGCPEDVSVDDMVQFAVNLRGTYKQSANEVEHSFNVNGRIFSCKTDAEGLPLSTPADVLVRDILYYKFTSKDIDEFL